MKLPKIYIDRWLVAPHYDQASHNLEWGTQMHNDKGDQLVNYTSRILGRHGVTRAILVSDPQNLTADLKQFRVATQGFSYLPEKSYEAFRQGDKVAAYGLGALVAGGAAAAVAKTGLLAGIFAFLAKTSVVFFKGIAVAVLGVIAAAGTWFKRLFKRGES